MLRISDVETYLKSFLTGIGYNPLPVFSAGPGANDDALDESPDRLVLLSFGSGAGMSNEYVFDNPALQVRTAGKQMDYNDAEQLAFDVDKGLLKYDHSMFMGTVWITSIQRAGGNPALLLKDNGDRYNFTCTYIVGAQAGLDA